MYSLSSVLTPAFIKNQLEPAIIYTYEIINQGETDRDEDFIESLGDGVYDTVMKWYSNRKKPFDKKLNKQDMNTLTYVIQMNLTSIKDTEGEEEGGMGKRVINMLNTALKKLKSAGFESPCCV